MNKELKKVLGAIERNTALMVMECEVYARANNLNEKHRFVLAPPELVVAADCTTIVGHADLAINDGSTPNQRVIAQHVVKVTTCV